MAPRGGNVKCSPGHFAQLIRGGLVNLKAFSIPFLEGHDMEVILERPEVAMFICDVLTADPYPGKVSLRNNMKSTFDVTQDAADYASSQLL
eukprot:11399944-Heterocapsa_arctica.AAC.1